jgi:hypothetical protein
MKKPRKAGGSSPGSQCSCFGSAPSACRLAEHPSDMVRLACTKCETAIRLSKYRACAEEVAAWPSVERNSIRMERSSNSGERAVNYIDKQAVLLGIAISIWIVLALLLANVRG